MKNISRRFFGAALALGFCFGFGPAAMSQEYPSKPIRFIVPNGPGNSVDIVTRLVASKLHERLGWNTVVENIAGGKNVPGARAVLDAPADGYTVFSPGASIAIYTAAGAPYDLVKDFDPVTRLIDLQIIIAASLDMPFDSIAEAVSYSKENPGKLTFAAYEAGSGTHLAGELLKLNTGIDMRHVPYKDSTFLVDLMSGRVALGVFSATTLAGPLAEGKIRALGVLGKRRSSTLPDVSTISEQGLPEMDAESWVGLIVKKGTPPEIIQTLNKEVVEILKLPDVVQRIEQIGGIPAGEEVASFDKKNKDDVEMYTNIL
ncbi:Bug family tripartite tricarboxylate transporter substrate binding protein [Propylenella binzhouense]|uniref:Tripartite tricarboxylate transporter substrate binding protein n=1 Tax=Propylenella binzhouense TaxID=2555902 RepID=A0A964WSD0_9HYPH|nr:tripartite tricarboxylate transporter substrate binding protein [Propylenella binzhouense]MYZ46849.1 tripartite tricarboxylate transporter substrate binding protein [Propylenella binzhouense]